MNARAIVIYTPPAPAWSILAAAAALERAELAECYAAKLRELIERMRAIVPVIVSNLEASP